MKLSLTRSEMLARWRLHRGYDIPAVGVVSGRTDGIDLDAVLSAEMDEWYGRLLASGPLRHLVSVQKAGSVVLPRHGSADTRISLGPAVVRVADVRLSSWYCSARVVDNPSSPLALRQIHPFTRASAESPVAVFDPVAKTLALYPYDPGRDSLLSLRVVEFHEDMFSFDSSALGSEEDG